jgi:phage terminase large subunit-like protein
MVEHPMTNARMAPESEALHEAIMRGLIRHDGDPEFASHVNSGVPTETERGWRLTKRKAKDKIDALIALLMAYDLAQRKPEPEDRSVYFL